MLTDSELAQMKADAERIARKSSSCRSIRSRAMIVFQQDIEVEVIDRFDEEADEIAESHPERFSKGEEVEADLVGDIQDDSIQIQFPNGSVTWVPKGSIQEVHPRRSCSGTPEALRERR